MRQVAGLDDREDRAKYLLLGQGGFRVNVGEDVGADVKAIFRELGNVGGVDQA